MSAYNTLLRWQQNRQTPMMIPTYDLTNYLVIAALLAFAIWHFTSLIRLSSLRLGSW
jgi:hypothetical protein